ncbi:MAG: hypothetical protein KatS3mg102_2180 [Planctomycetota bacterium]|nr:MAG: hypothetical protein KatS3mg102_2180 [Planctomycetota bacterium]
MRQLTAVVSNVHDRLSRLEGLQLELEYERKAPAYFGRLLRRTRVVRVDTLLDELEKSLTPEEIADLLYLDLLVTGRPLGTGQAEPVWVGVEISKVVDASDVIRRRAAHRAAAQGRPARRGHGRRHLADGRGLRAGTPAPGRDPRGRPRSPLGGGARGRAGGVAPGGQGCPLGALPPPRAQGA